MKSPDGLSFLCGDAHARFFRAGGTYATRQRPSSPWRGFRVSQTNDQKLMKLHGVFETLLRKVLVRGVHGEVLVKFSVHDGMIELIEECVKRKHR
jgi:hypothetical protein